MLRQQTMYLLLAVPVRESAEEHQPSFPGASVEVLNKDKISVSAYESNIWLSYCDNSKKKCTKIATFMSVVDLTRLSTRKTILSMQLDKLHLPAYCNACRALVASSSAVGKLPLSDTCTVGPDAGGTLSPPTCMATAESPGSGTTWVTWPVSSSNNCKLSTYSRKWNSNSQLYRLDEF